MMKKFFLCLWNITLGFNFAFSQWINVSSGTEKPLQDIKFVTDKLIVISGGDEIIKTTDGGLNWSKKPLVDKAGSPIQFASIDHLKFLSETEAIGVGLMYLGNTEVILKTTNGGNNWSIVNASEDGAWPRAINQTEFNGITCIAVGTNGRILKSANSGDTWVAVSSGTTKELKSVKWIGGSTFIAVGKEVILRSVNEGTSWTIQSFPNRLFRWVDFQNSAIGMAVGDNGLVMNTTDGGISWTPSASLLELDFKKIKYNNGVAFMVSDKVCITTNDQGKTWGKQEFPNSILKAIDLKGDNAYLVGDHGEVFKNSAINAIPPTASFNSDKLSYCQDSVAKFSNTSVNADRYEWFLDGVQIGKTKDFTCSFPIFSKTYEVKLVAYKGVSYSSYARSYPIYNTLAINLSASMESDQVCPSYPLFVKVQNSKSDISYQLFKGTVAIGVLQKGNNSSLTFLTEGITQASELSLVASKTNVCGTYKELKTFSLKTTAGLPAIELQPLNLQEPPQPDPRIMALNFIDDKTGFALDNAHFLSTIDGGVNWNVASPFYNYGYYDLQFFDKKNGFIANRSLYRTKDGGISFKILSGITDVIGLKFLDTTTGFVLSSTSSYNEIYKTTDGGANFKKVFSIGKYPNFSKLKCPSSKVCYVPLYNRIYNAPDSSDYLIKTIDGGESWKQIKIPSGCGFEDLHFTDENTGYSVSGGRIFKTIDGGIHWTYQTVVDMVNDPHLFERIQFVSPSVGYAAGLNVVYKTENAGECWHKVHSLPTGQSILDMDFPSSNTGYFSGAVSSFGKGTIYKTQLGNQAWFLAADTLVCEGDSLYCENKSVGFSVFEWYVDGEFRAGTRNAKLPFPLVGTHTIKLIGKTSLKTDSAKFTVRVSAPVSLYADWNILKNQIICANTSVSFNAMASENVRKNTKFAYQWQWNRGKGFENIGQGFAGATTKSELMFLGTADSLNGTKIRCQYTAQCAQPYLTNEALLTVKSAPKITSQPQSFILCLSQKVAKFTVVADAEITGYQWKYIYNYNYVDVPENALFSGGKTSQLTVKLDEEWLKKLKFYCIVGNACGETGTVNADITLSSCTGIESSSNEKGDILIFPNPSSSEIITVKSVSLPITKLVLSDVDGIQEQSLEFVSPQQENILSIKGVHSGIHFLSITFQDGSKQMKKIIINDAR